MVAWKSCSKAALVVVSLELGPLAVVAALLSLV